MGAMALPRKMLEGLIRPFGYRVSRIDPHIQFEPRHQTIIDRVRPFTMTSAERIVATCHAVDYVTRYGIQGDFVECGVWRGGSTMAAALSYLSATANLPTLHLFDTFEGMTAPTEVDRKVASGEAAATLLQQFEHYKCYAAIDDVRRNLQSTGYPANRIRFVKGKVEDTIPAAAPAQIAVLRLDTDWYDSTKHELEHLFPRLSVGGVLIVDDYGDWEGARKAVDEYFQIDRMPMHLVRTDYTGRVGVKLAS